MPTTSTAAITDSRFNALKAKLRELFELDKSDLDFGIYRIMAAKNKEVTDFLDRQLKDVVRQTLAEHGAGAVDQVEAELEKAIAQARELGVDPESSQKVKDLRARLASAGRGSAAELEADIYNHLLAFFGRYYDEGDFISQRRYKGDTYAIPYSGEEVTLHWANKDQYYIKSGEWHKDYRFKLADGRRVRFALVDATQETGNNKEPDEAKRRYIICVDEPVVAEGDTLTLRFEFRVPTQDEQAEAADDVVSIFGGDYAKEKSPKKGDERTQFCADAEEWALEHMPAGWRDAVTAAAATDDKPLRTVLGKHLDHFTARNTFDYFIHKDLGGFLRRELDFYIKNEVVRLDDLDTAPADHLQRVQGRVKAIRRVASTVIDLLASLEDFQKKLWLKKKFVLNTSWLVTVDRVPDKLRDVVAANKGQWAEWERLGFKPDRDTTGQLFGRAKWGTRAYLDACDKLVVDTRLYGEAFTTELLASDELLSGHPSVSDATAGLLINGENHQALNLLAAMHRTSVDVIFIDPPYNTGFDDFEYKDAYQHSSWMSCIADRLDGASPLTTSDTSIWISIDDREVAHCRYLLDANGSPFHFVADLAWQKVYSPRMDATQFSTSYDHILVAAGTPEWSPRKRTIEPDISQFPHVDEEGRRYRSDPLRKWGKNSLRTDRPNLWFPIPSPEGEDVFPIKPDGTEGCWRWQQTTVTARYSELDWLDKGNGNQPYLRQYADESTNRPVETLWPWELAGSTHEAQEVIKALFGRIVFTTPKPTQLVANAVLAGGDSQAIVLDFFAGSGTTGHSVLALNREDQGTRTFILVEMGVWFGSVLYPRTTKVIYSPDWKDGRAKTHDQGLSALVKCFAVESYEDALNNLPTPTGDMFDGRTPEEADALIRYALDLELGPHLLDLDIFRDPWGHTINAQLAGDDEIRRHKVDLVETFNYLLGLRVSAYGPMERYSAEFERAEHDDGLGRLKLKGRLKRDPGGPFVFQRVEGVLNDGNDTRVLVVWRKLTDDPEQDAAILDAWMARHREATTERTEHRDYHLIYINGPVTLPQPTAEIRTVYPTEEVFKAKMFEDTDGAANG